MNVPLRYSREIHDSQKENKHSPAVLNINNLTSLLDPGPISNLILTSGYDYIVAMWDPPVGSYSSFTVNIQLDGIIVTETPDLTQPTKRFNSLKAAANYTVTVYTVSGHLSSLLVAESKYTCESLLFFTHLCV